MTCGRCLPTLVATFLLLLTLLPQVAAAPGLVSVSHFRVRTAEGENGRAVAAFRPPDAGEKLPLLIAFHGMGEARLGPARGYAAWVERYGLLRGYEALLAAPLSPAAFGGLVREGELATFNAALRKRAFQGLLVVGVYTPDLLGEARQPERVERYAEWVAHELVPQLHARFEFASTAPRELGVDGVSLGGMVALEVGLRYPELFGAVGALQPAVRGREAELASLAERARTRARQALRLMSSDRDPLLPVVQKLSRELRKRYVPHRLVVSPGGHDYAFNRGPGVLELLHFHDRVLRAQAE